MKDKILTSALNLFKIKTIVTFIIMGLFTYCVLNNKQNETVVMFATWVIKNLFDRMKEDGTK